MNFSSYLFLVYGNLIPALNSYDFFIHMIDFVYLSN